MLLYISIYCICISLLSNSAATSNMCFCLHTVFICISIFQQCGCREPKVLAVITPSSYHPPSQSAMTTFYLGANKHLNPSVCLNFPTVQYSSRELEVLEVINPNLLWPPFTISNDDVLPRCLKVFKSICLNFPTVQQQWSYWKHWQWSLLPLIIAVNILLYIYVPTVHTLCRYPSFTTHTDMYNII